MVCIKQHLSNILSSIHQEVKQHWGWAEKGVVYKKKRVLQDLANQSTNYLMFVIPFLGNVKLSSQFLFVLGNMTHWKYVRDHVIEKFEPKIL